MLWAIVQLGLMYRANSGIQHALGEGARYATLYPHAGRTTTIKDQDATPPCMASGLANSPSSPTFRPKGTI